jgi:predicted dehydrogenase
MAHMLNCFQAADPEVVLAGVVDPTPKAVLQRLPEGKFEDIRFHDTLDDLLAEGRLDALAIGTRCDLHSPFAIRAMQAGIPLFLEKPVATTMKQARALERAFSQAKAEVVVSFPLRVTPLFQIAQSLLAEDAVGRPEHILGINYVPYGDVYFNSWYRDYRVTQGLFLQKATHDFDYLAHLVGSPIVRVAAMAQHGRVYRDKSQEPAGGDSARHYYEDIGTPDSGMNEDASSALLEFANGAQGLYTQVFYSRHRAAARGATISGIKGTLQFDWYKDAVHVFHHDADRVTTKSTAGSHDHFGGDEILAENFVNVIRGRAGSVSPISAGLRSVYACLAAKESAETGRFVEVQPLTELDLD